jgi:hypothetical protein
LAVEHEIHNPHERNAQVFAGQPRRSRRSSYLDAAARPI